MNVTAALVQTLHRINRQKTDLKSQLDRGPKTVGAARAKLQSAEDNVQRIRDSLTKAKMAADAKQLQMKEREDKIHNLEGKLNAAKENREYQALKDQIAADTQANLVLSDEILEILESIDTIGVELEDANAQVLKMKDEFERISKQVADRRVVLESELERVEADLVVAESELTGDFKREYMRLVSVKGEDAMAGLEGKCCGGCYQNLTPQLLDRLSMQQPVICPSCGRLVYQDRN